MGLPPCYRGHVRPGFGSKKQKTDHPSSLLMSDGPYYLLWFPIFKSLISCPWRLAFYGNIFVFLNLRFVLHFWHADFQNAVFKFGFDVFLCYILSHIEASAAVILASALVSSFTGIFLAMMVVSLAGNRVEGLAASKLMGISFAGLILIWFLPAPYYYVVSFLPSFWVGKLMTDGAEISSLLFGLFTCLLWITFFTRKFLKKV